MTAIDAMTPIGRGQRELIIGDRRPEKPRSSSTPSSTSAAKGNCVYVAIGQKMSTIVRS
jgi:F-type H+-transporting ATPase subunit alpha